MDQVMAIENGGDDYIVKPFSPDVVMAKIRSLLRRAYGDFAGTKRERIVELNDLKLYTERHELQFDKNSVLLTQNETYSVDLLIARCPRVPVREDFLEKFWDNETYVYENRLNVNIARTRKKFQELGLTNVIETIRGSGYLLKLTWEQEL